MLYGDHAPPKSVVNCDIEPLVTRAFGPARTGAGSTLIHAPLHNPAGPELSTRVVPAHTQSRCCSASHLQMQEDLPPHGSQDVPCSLPVPHLIDQRYQHALWPKCCSAEHHDARVCQKLSSLRGMRQLGQACKLRLIGFHSYHASTALLSGQRTTLGCRALRESQVQALGQILNLKASPQKRVCHCIIRNRDHNTILVSRHDGGEATANGLPAHWG